MAKFVFNLQTFKTDTTPKNDCHFTFKLPNLMNGMSNKIYSYTESKDIKKLWSEVKCSLGSSGTFPR